MVTGDDSGVFPDAVSAGLWYVGAGSGARLEFTGLNPTKRYRFVLFASRVGSGPKTSFYQLQDQSGYLDATNNSSNSLQLANVQPDAEGRVQLAVSAAPNSSFAYLNGLTLEEQ